MATGFVVSPGQAQQVTPPVAATFAPVREPGGSILERMQDEVAAIASQARSGIVTIEDARAVVYNYTASALRKTDLQNQIKFQEINRAAAVEKLRIEQARYNAGVDVTKLALDRAKYDLARVDLVLSALHHTLASMETSDPLLQRKQELDDRIAELEADRKFYAEQEQLVQQQVNVGAAPSADLIEARRQLAHVMQDLATARQPQQFQLRTVFGQSDVATLLASSFGNGNQSAPKSGSGFSIGEGYILTTADVVEGVSNPIVTTDDGRRARATLVAVDSELNIGLLRLPPAMTVAALKLGDSARVAPGHFAISIGNQAGQINSVSLSLISGMRSQGIASSRHFYPDLLQIDGAMGGGISGAPVLSARGEVIGMWAAFNNEAASYTNSAFTPQFNLRLGGASETVTLKGSPDGGRAEVFLSPVTPGGANQPTLITPDALPSLRGQNNPSNVTPAPPAKDPRLNVQIYDKSAYRQADGRKANDPVSAPHGTLNGQYVPIITLTPGQNLGVSSVPYKGAVFFATPTTFTTTTNANPPAPSAASGFAIPVNAFKGLIERLKTGKNVVHAWLGVDLEDVDNAREENGFVRMDKQVKVRNLYADSPAAKSGGVQAGDILVSLSDTPVHTGNEVRSTVLQRFTPGQKINVTLLRAGKAVSATLTLEARPATTPAMLTSPQNSVTIHF